jgi:hypothetical protein
MEEQGEKGDSGHRSDYIRRLCRIAVDFGELQLRTLVYAASDTARHRVSQLSHDTALIDWTFAAVSAYFSGSVLTIQSVNNIPDTYLGLLPFGRPLIYAVASENIDLLEQLLEETYVYHNTYWLQALFVAGRRGLLTPFITILTARTSKLGRQYLPRILRQTARGGHVCVLSYLLENIFLFVMDSDDPRSINRGFLDTPKEASLEIILLEACTYGHLGAMHFAFENGADPIHKFAYSHHKLLSIAARKGYIQIVKLLLVHPKMSGYSTSYSDFQDYLNRALSSAARCGWLQIAALLIEHGAQINRKHGLSQSPWVNAVEGRQLDMLYYLIKKGAVFQDGLVKKQLTKDDIRQYKAIVTVLENSSTHQKNI